MVAQQVHNVQVIPLCRPVESSPPVYIVLGVCVHTPGEVGAGAGGRKSGVGGAGKGAAAQVQVVLKWRFRRAWRLGCANFPKMFGKNGEIEKLKKRGPHVV